MSPGTDPVGADAGEPRRLGARPNEQPRYEIRGEIGRGAMGRVLRVHDRVLDRDLAMKLLDQSEVPRAQLERFLDEARLTSQLDHPSIVGVHDVGELEDGSVFYTMPLVDGRTLDEVLDLARRGAEGWSRARVLTALLKACEGLSFAHARGIVHRDLKPSNLMVGKHGEVLVMDWGLARRWESARGAVPAVAGTPATMAPEVLGGEAPPDPRQDVYSFGAILYAVCCGHLPFEDKDSTPEVERMLRKPPTRLAHLTPETSADLVAITEKAMARDARERYPTMDELRADLERFVEGRIVAAHPVGRVARVRRWAARHPQLAASAVIVFVLLLALVLVQHDKVQSVARAHGQTLRRAYAANLSAAEAGLRMHEAAEAKRRLDDCDPGLRGWEWGHLKAKSDSAARVVAIGDSQDDVEAVAAGAGGSFATGSGRSVTLWSAEGARLGGTKLEAEVQALAFNRPAGELIAGLSNGALVHLDADDLTERERRSAFGQAISAVAVTTDGSTLVACSTLDGEVMLQRDGQTPLRTAVENPFTVTFVGEHRVAVASAASVVLLLDVKDLSEVGRIESSAPRSLATHPDGRRLAIGGFSGSVTVFEIDGGAPPRVALRLEAHTGLVGALAWSLDGAVLASASDDRTLRLWNANTGQTSVPCLGHEAPVEALAALEGGGFISGSADGTARTWHRSGAAELVFADNADWVVDVAVFDEGRRVASIDWSAYVRIRDAQDGRVLREVELPEKASALAAAAEGTQLACGVAGQVLVFDADTGHELRRHALPSGHALALAWSGTTLLARTSTGEVLALPERGAPSTLAADLALGHALAVDHGRRRAAIDGPSDQVRVIDLDSPEESQTFSFGEDAVTALAFAPDGHLVVGTSAGELMRFQEGSSLAPVLSGHAARVTTIAFTPDGARTVSGSKDGTVRVWDQTDLLLTLRGHDGWVTSLDVGAGGETIASASRDGTVRLWRSR